MRTPRPVRMALLSLLVSSPVAAQNAMLVPTAPLTLDEAMRWAWQRGVAASVARLNTVVADARVGQRRADLLPQVEGDVDYSRQTLNLDEFGIPIATGVTEPFNLYHFRLAGSQTLVNLAAMSRVKSASDSSVAARFDAQSTGSNAAALAGVAYVRVLGIAETIRAREADSAIAADLLAQARQLADAGISAAIDVTRNEVNLAAVRTQLVITRAQYARARLDLARALSIAPEAPIVLADSSVRRTSGSRPGRTRRSRSRRSIVPRYWPSSGVPRRCACPARRWARRTCPVPASRARYRRADSRSTHRAAPGPSGSVSPFPFSMDCAGRSVVTK